MRRRWPIVVWLCIVLVLLLWALKIDLDIENEYKLKFAKCMDDVHNVYVCETYSRTH